MGILDFSKPLSELVEENPKYLVVLRQLGLDSEVALGLSLADICSVRGLSVREIEIQLEACANQSKLLDEKALAEYGIPELIGYILFTHHDYMTKELPRLERLLASAVQADGEAHPELIELKHLYHRFKESFLQHMGEEERLLFPFYLLVASTEKAPVLDEEGIEMLIGVVRYEDEEIHRDLNRIREKTREYHVPADAGEDYRKWITDLRLLEIDLQHHIRVENRILFPKVIAAEARLLNQKAKAEAMKG